MELDDRQCLTIKKNEAKLRAYKHKMTEMGVQKFTTKSMKMGAYDKLDEALYIWLSLREIAAKKRFSSLHQTTMTSFFE